MSGYGGLYGGRAYRGGANGGQNGGSLQNPNDDLQTPNRQGARQGPTSRQQFGGGYNPSNNYNPLNQGPQYSGGPGLTPLSGGLPAVTQTTSSGNTEPFISGHTYTGMLGQR